MEHIAVIYNRWSYSPHTLLKLPGSGGLVVAALTGDGRTFAFFCQGEAASSSISMLKNISGYVWDSLFNTRASFKSISMSTFILCSIVIHVLATQNIALKSTCTVCSTGAKLDATTEFYYAVECCSG